MKTGDKLKFDSEKQRYTVQAFDGRYILATKPFNARKTYLYTIVDLKEKIRGPVGLVFGLIGDVDSPKGAQACLRDLQSGRYGLSSVRRKSAYLADAEFERCKAWACNALGVDSSAPGLAI